MTRWRSVRQNGNFLKWETPGQMLEGIFEGTIEGQYGTIGKIETDTGEVLFPMRTVLAIDLGGVKIGTLVRITFLGQKTNGKSGRTYQAFDVAVSDGEEDPEHEALATVRPRDDDGHPVNDPEPERSDDEVPFE